MSKKNVLVKPYLKWAGGKRQLLPELKKYVPKNFEVYYEPFVGAGALLFSLQPNKFVINDMNSDLITTYQEIKDNVESLIECLKEHKTKNKEDHYYSTRDEDRDPSEFSKLTSTKKAARLIYLNKTCYNGLYRVNSQGMFNTPFGFYKNPGICDEPILRAVSDFLNNASSANIMNGDFEKCVEKATKKDFIYFDPPYHSPSKTNFTGYQPNGFNDEEQERLSKVFGKLADKGVKCMLSNSSTPLIKELYNRKDFRIMTVQANRAINSNSSGRGSVDEVIILNWWPDGKNKEYQRRLETIN